MHHNLAALVLIAVFMLPAAATADPPPSPPHPPQGPDVYTNPDWVRRPSAQELLAVYPRSTAATLRGGRATIQCVATPLGALRDCTVVLETPAGSGFGAAAVALSAQLVFRPATRNGQPIESTVRIPLIWPPLNAQRANLMTHPMITNPPWIRAPSAADVAAALPARARATPTLGHATLRCPFRDNGNLGDCRVISEEPETFGFGNAARSLARHFQAQIPDPPLPTSLGHYSADIAFTFPPMTQATGAPASVGHPRWIHLPAAQDARGVYPAAAMAAGTAGQGVVQCTVDQGGHLADCQVVGETPAGQGFGAAALALTPFFRMSVWSDDGLPAVGARIRFPIGFQPPPATTPAAN